MQLNKSYPIIKLFRYFMVVAACSGLSQAGYAGGLDFVKNGQQWPQQVQYKASLPGGSVFFTPNSFVYSYYSAADRQLAHEMQEKKERKPMPIHWHAYQVLFAGCNPDVAVSGNDKRSYYQNYFIGNDPSKWSSGLPVYENIRYHELYPGIDLAVYSTGSSMKYDFIAAPGTDPSVIRLKFEGVQPRLTPDGAIELHTSVNTVVEQAPYVYQLINGQKQEVTCRYSINSNGEVSFIFPEGYDTGKPLVIDPTVAFVTWSGATGVNWGACATYDAAGNLYATSQLSSGWPVTLGAFQTSPSGGGFGMPEIGINKYSSNGTALIYSTYLGGNDGNSVINMVVNASNELVVFGNTASTDFPTTPGCFQNARNGFYSDFFVTHFNAAGTVLIGSTYLGGSGEDGGVGGDIQIDQQGNFICAASTLSANFPVTPGAYQPVYSDSADGCVFKFNPTCTSLLSSTYIGGTGDDFIKSLRQTSSGNIVICGETVSANYPTTPGVMLPVAQGRGDGFISVFNSNTTALLHSTYIGTARMDNCLKLQVDTGNNIYVAGFTKGVYPVTPGLYSNPNGAFFLHKLSPSLTGIQSTRIGGDTTQVSEFGVFAFLVDYCGYVYYALYTGDPNLPITAGAYQATPAVMYLSRLTPDMTTLNYATYLGSVNDGAHGHGNSTFDPNGVLYTTLCMTSFAINTPGAWRPVSLIGGLPDGLSFKFRFDPVMPRAIPGIAGNDTGCLPFTVQFVNNSTSATAYLWDFGDGNTSTAAAPIHTYTSPGSYYAVLKAYNPAACKTVDADSVLITVLEHDTLRVVSDSVLCQPGPLLLRAPPGYQNYQWQDGSTALSLPATTGGIYFVVSANVCDVRIDTFRVKEIDLAFSLGPDTTMCTPYILAGRDIPGAGYQWNTGSTDPSIRVTASDRYWLKIAKEGCSYSDTAIVTYKANKVTATDVLFCNLQPINHRLRTTIPQGSTALWNTGSTDSQIVAHATGAYWVTVSNGSCYSSDTTRIAYEYCDCSIFIPTAFSPNNDGMNDLFHAQLPSGCSVTNFTLSVYNRWGQKIFTTNDISKGWDGNSNGQTMEQGVYMYTLEGYAGSKEVHKKLKGDVTLIR